MSPKDKVRANVYRELLAQRKTKNKKLSTLSVGVFFIGIFAVSTYNNFTTKKVENYAAIDTNITKLVGEENFATKTTTAFNSVDEYFNTSNDRTIKVNLMNSLSLTKNLEEACNNEKIVLTFLFIFISALTFANNDLGMIQESELISVGVKENIKKAKALIDSVGNSYKG